MSHIESVFESKSKENAEAGKYLQQWHVAKTHVPQLLNTISHYFPHYSLHDSTHSETILNNIELIMGAEVIDKLSIVDLWLLLSASYYHDLGMVITRDDKLECLKEGSAFINYVRSKQDDETSPMHNYALCFEIRDNKLFHKNNEITRRTRQTLWSAVQMLTQKLCCQTIHDCPKVVPLHYESE